MASPDVSRSQLKQIETALRKTTEALATELSAPTGTAPDWTDFEWCIARAAAAIHGVSPLLSSTLRWRGPESWERFLGEQRDHTFERHLRIAELLEDIGSRAARDGIAMVPLKGAALHEIGIYQPGERPMSDIDLLVQSTDLEATTRLLGAYGYHVTYTTWKHLVFESEAATETVGLGENPHHPIKIEVHTGVVERMPVVDRDISALVFPSSPAAGLNSYPSMAALMLHLLTHAAGTMCSRTLRILHLHDIALLARRMTSSDWEAVFSTANGQASWWVSPPLALAAQYNPGAIPPHIVQRAEADCRWPLRQIYRHRKISDVSLSNLWIEAFPGIEWSQSTQEICRYVMSRVKPDGVVLSGRKKVVEMYPDRARFAWLHLSQEKRIVRWILQRPARVETLTCVCAALAHLDAQPRLTQHP